MTREAISTLIIEWEQYKKGHQWESQAINVEAFLMDEFARLKALSLQPAEGAEDDHSEDIALMAEFASTLHAQKIADKMVEDMRQKLFSMRATKKTMDMLSEADRLITYGYHDCINEMLMWTKSRDSHE